MEKLPQCIENKIFYYLCHPIAKALKRRTVVVLKRFDIQKFDWKGTVIAFSPEKITRLGLLRFSEKGSYKIDGFLDVFGENSPTVCYSVFRRGVGCFGGTAFLVYRFLNKHLCIEHINYVIIKFFAFESFTFEARRKNKKIEIEIKNSPISKLKITMNRTDFKTIKIYKVMERCIF